MPAPGRRLRRRKVRDRNTPPRSFLINFGTCLALLGLAVGWLGVFGWQNLDSFSQSHRAAGGSFFLMLTGLFLIGLGILRIRQGLRARRDRGGPL